jgi:uncharacterized protein
MASEEAGMTPGSPTTIDLDRLGLSFGEASRLELPIRPGTLELGGQSYGPAAETVTARLDVSRTSSGYAFRLRFPLRLAGPCMRCLEPAAVASEVDAREIDQPQTGDEELTSPYVSEGELDVARWAHDAIALAVPAQLLCREDCAGLCPVCGESLNDTDPEAHRHATGGDPRWAKLRELRLD